jgi:hypothetical protein
MRIGMYQLLYRDERIFDEFFSRHYSSKKILESAHMQVPIFSSSPDPKGCTQILIQELDIPEPLTKGTPKQVEGFWQGEG